MNIVLPEATALLYLIATGTFILYVVFLKDILSRVSSLILLFGFLLHTAAPASRSS
jgi:hypothetical protein